MYVSKKQYYKLRLFFFNIIFRVTWQRGNIISSDLHLIFDLNYMLQLFHACNAQSMTLDTLKAHMCYIKGLSHLFS